MYTTTEEANNRLRGTIVDFDGAPVLIEGSEQREEGIVLSYYEWPYNGRLKRVSINDPRWNKFVPPKLGFMNYFDQNHSSAHCCWCTRLPVRNMQQGLTDRNFNCATINGVYRWRLGDVRATDAFKEMFEGLYPTFEEALQLLNPNSAIAIDREFCLSQSVEGYTSLYWQRDNLGLVMDNTIYLRQDRQWVREMILECDKLPNDIQNLR